MGRVIATKSPDRRCSPDRARLAARLTLFAIHREREAPERRSATPAERRKPVDRPAHALGAVRGGFCAISPLTLRILAVNMMAVVILVAGLLYLGQYQDNLIQSHLEALEGDSQAGGRDGRRSRRYRRRQRPLHPVPPAWRAA